MVCWHRSDVIGIAVAAGSRGQDGDIERETIRGRQVVHPGRTRAAMPRHSKTTLSSPVR